MKYFALETHFLIFPPVTPCWVGVSYRSAHVSSFHPFTSSLYLLLPSRAKQQQHLIRVSPLQHPFLFSCSLYINPPPLLFRLHSAPFSFLPFVCLFVHGQVCVRVCARAYTHPCVWEKMSVTGFEREHVCPGTNQTPPLPSHSPSLTPPLPLRPSALCFTCCSAYKVPQRRQSVPTCCCPALHFLFCFSPSLVFGASAFPDKVDFILLPSFALFAVNPHHSLTLLVRWLVVSRSCKLNEKDVYEAIDVAPALYYYKNCHYYDIDWY